MYWRIAIIVLVFFLVAAFVVLSERRDRKRMERIVRWFDMEMDRIEREGEAE